MLGSCWIVESTMLMLGCCWIVDAGQRWADVDAGLCKSHSTRFWCMMIYSFTLCWLIKVLHWNILLMCEDVWWYIPAHCESHRRWLIDMFIDALGALMVMMIMIVMMMMMMMVVMIIIWLQIKQSRRPHIGIVAIVSIVAIGIVSIVAIHWHWHCCNCCPILLPLSSPVWHLRTPWPSSFSQDSLWGVIAVASVLPLRFSSPLPYCQRAFTIT